MGWILPSSLLWVLPFFKNLLHHHLYYGHAEHVLFNIIYSTLSLTEGEMYVL